MPVEVPGRKGTTTVDTDEHIRPGVTAGDLARLQPAFAKEGTVTAGNASGINDAAAAVVLAGEDLPNGTGATRWAGSSPTATPGSSRGSWASGRCPRCARYWTAPA